MLDKEFQKLILRVTKANSMKKVETIQELWSGYGEIVRYELKGSSIETVIVKHVKLPEKGKHPRGWNTDISHKRKLKSYKVEVEWYKNWANKSNDNCYIPNCLALEKKGDEVLIVMEDLDMSGYAQRKSSVTWLELKVCIKWLANFHAVFMEEKADKLWKVGTYWHLDTRPEELKVLDDKDLKNVAGLIDERLKKVKYKSFVHGDAKLANFCFSDDGKKVAAVDFQYVGAGCGMKDLAYFVGSCFHEDDCENYELEILDYYFLELKDAIKLNKKDIDFDDLEKEWRLMYYIAWTDFHRFLKGWSPGHWKINSYSEKVAREVIKNIKEKKYDIK